MSMTSHLALRNTLDLGMPTVYGNAGRVRAQQHRRSRTTRITLGAAHLQAGKGGIARLARITAKALAQFGHDVRALSLLDPSAPAIEGVRVRSAAGNRVAFVAGMHMHALDSDLLMFDAVSMARARPRIPGLNRPYAVWMCGIEAWELLKPRGRRSYEQADLVLPISNYTLDRHQALHGKLAKTGPCWLATEEDAAAPRLRDRSGPPTVLILGRVEHSEQYKGHYELIRAWPEVCARVPGARLLIVGEGGDLENVRAAAARSPSSGQIQVLGFVPEEEMGTIWARANVFAMPCRGGGFGFVYVEAMRHGLPVIASTHDAASEVNIHGETGFNLDLADSAGLSDRLARLLEDHDLAGRMGAAGFARWNTHFRFSAFAQRLGALLEARGLVAAR